MKKDNPRVLAAHALIEVIEKHRTLKDVLSKTINLIPERDRGFFHDLLYGTIRELLYIDWRLSYYLPKPERLKSFTRANLRLGAYQILKMRVPAWAAVHETVETEKYTGKNTKLINAVLRRIAEEQDEPPLPTDTIRQFSIKYSHPEWLVERYIDRFGVNEAEELLKKNQQPAPLTLRVNTLKLSRDGFIQLLNQKNIRAIPTKYSPSGVIIEDRLSYRELKELLEYATVQDEAAQLIVLFSEPSEGQRILDSCAAPGGKTSFIYELTGGRAKIVALDQSAERIKLLQKTLKNLSVDIIQADLRKVSFGEPFQRIILDAPCSSLGVVSKNPDVKFHVSEDRLNALKEKQIELLEAATRLLAPGGMIVYSVCSFEPEETEQVVKALLNKYAEFFIIKDRPAEEVAPFVDSQGYFYSFPHRHNMDGHFAVRIGRRL